MCKNVEADKFTHRLQSITKIVFGFFIASNIRFHPSGIDILVTFLTFPRLIPMFSIHVNCRGKLKETRYLRLLFLCRLTSARPARHHFTYIASESKNRQTMAFNVCVRIFTWKARENINFKSEIDCLFKDITIFVMAKLPIVNNMCKCSH